MNETSRETASNVAATNGNGPVAGSKATDPQRWLRTPPIDIYETEDGLVLLADLPGVTADGVDLQIQDNRLTLFGRCQPAVPDDDSLVHQEYQHGDFLRSFILSDDVNHDGIAAKLQNGVLEVRLPRTPRTEPRKIQVRAE
ncbi:MAG: Hsp20/alpha crystallin family protein [Planctomycetaceae bacterium]|nr:Hsp20/alpha crystallin family protein [Planctomycetaceae bacterium]